MSFNRKVTKLTVKSLYIGRHKDKNLVHFRPMVEKARTVSRYRSAFDNPEE